MSVVDRSTWSLAPLAMYLPCAGLNAFARSWESEPGLMKTWVPGGHWKTADTGWLRYCQPPAHPSPLRVRDMVVYTNHIPFTGDIVRGRDSRREREPVPDSARLCEQAKLALSPWERAGVSRELRRDEIHATVLTARSLRRWA